MNKGKVNSGIILRTPLSFKKLLEMFLQEYDYLFWIYRVLIFQEILENPLICDRIGKKIFVKGNLSKTYTSAESITNRIKLEIHFIAYHSTEALFALIFAFSIEPEVPWVWLTSYKFPEFNELISEIAQKGFINYNSDEKLVVRSLFYSVPDIEHKDKIKNSINFTLDYLKELAKDFQDKYDYNAYKHGLRTLKPKLVPAKLRTLNGRTLIDIEALATRYLELDKPVKKEGKMYQNLRHVTKAIDFERSIRIIDTNTRLIHNLLEIQKTLFYNKGPVNLNLFEKEMNAFSILKPTKNGVSFQKITYKRDKD